MWRAAGERISPLDRLWLATLLSIPALSLFGRSLQEWLVAGVGSWLLGVLVFTALALTLWWSLRRLDDWGVQFPVYHLVWLLLFFLGGPLLLGRVEERIHFLVFGVFGALAMLKYRPGGALLLCLMFSLGDELLQHFLPYRVGDFKDVAVNLLASLAAALFVWLTCRRESDKCLSTD